MASAETQSKAQLRRELAGDLDNIVLHAMSKEPERRYTSPEHLAADIRNYLEGRPVAAREVTFFYRAGKTIRRNKAVSIAAALLIVSLTGGVYSTYYQARRAERRFAGPAWRRRWFLGRSEGAGRTLLDPVAH